MSGFASVKFVPMYDIEGYISSSKITGEAAETLRKLHASKTVTKVTRTPFVPKVKRWDHGYFDNGKIVYPYEEAWPYLRKNEIVPFDIRMRCALRNGMPQSQVDMLLWKRKKYETESEIQKRDDEWTRLFS